MALTRKLRLNVYPSLLLVAWSTNLSYDCFAPFLSRLALHVASSMLVFANQNEDTFDFDPTNSYKERLSGNSIF